MKITKKALVMIMAAAITLGFFSAMPPAKASMEPATYASNSKPVYDNVDLPAELAAALAINTGAGPIINISGSFEYTDTITVNLASVVINLNGHTLTVNTEGAGITSSRSFCSLIINGPGTLNVTGTQYGIFVTSVAGGVESTGGAVVNAASLGNGSSGVYAGNGSHVSIIGTAAATGTNSRAVFADGSGLWRLLGMEDWFIVHSSVNIVGSAAASGNDSYGAFARNGGKIYLSGGVSGEKSDIRVGNSELPILNPTTTNAELPAPDEGNYPPPAGYYWDEYSDGISYVYRRQSIMPVVELDPVTAFVTRLYKNVLERDPDTDGLNAWVNRLTSNEYGGGQAAESFFFGAPYYEFLNRGLRNDEYLLILYNTFMDREPDSFGWAVWMMLMDEGMSWKEVFDGFVVSEEFGDRCDAAGIRR